LSLLSVWLALLSLVFSLTMLVYRPAFSDGTIVAALYSAIAAGTLAGVVLWSTRGQRQEFVLARQQAKVAAALAASAAAVVYLLVAFAQRVPAP
jgi:hypothetical protein